MDYNKYLNKSKEKYNELDQIKKDAESMESTMMKPKMKHIDLDIQDAENINQNSNTQNNNFVYKTQGAQDIDKLRVHLTAVLKLLKHQNFINKETGLLASINKRTIEKISSDKAINKSLDNGFTKEEHFEVAEDIAPLYENATLKETHADRKGNEQSNIANVHRFNIDVEVNNKDTTVKITMFEKIEGKNMLYSIELNPSLEYSRVLEEEMAKLAQHHTTAHTEVSHIANFDNETIPQNSNECQEQNDSNSVSNEFNENISKKRRV